MSSIVNKIKDAVHGGDKHHEQPEGTAGPHGSRVANTADPRVDSDRDHRGNPANSIGTGHSGSTTGPTHTSGSYGTTGPHSSDMMNKVDPRVDSDRDNRANPMSSAGTGMTGSHGTSGLTGSHGTSGMTGSGMTGSGMTGSHGSSGLTGSHGTSGMTGSHGTSGFGSSNTTTGYNDPTGTHGPHGSRMANAVDPRVDSDRDHRGVGNTMGSSTHGTSGMTGTHGSHGTHGTSGLGTSGPGPAQNTAGPHKSDMMNKVDPRVDSDMDGSKTIGQDQTYRSDPTDAAQVPPSVMQKHIGAPTVAHDDHSHNRARRNSRATDQELHRGI